MSCFFPNMAHIEPVPDDAHLDSRFARKRVHFLGKFNYDKDSELLKDGYVKLIPCGKCLGCKLDYARSWSDRLVLEMEAQKTGVFLTLTYDSANLPSYVDPETGECVSRFTDLGTPVAPLVKFHISEFMKNLRASLSYRGYFKYDESGKLLNPLRFFACGEYGSLRHRPHYHMVLFPLSFDDLSSFGDLFPHDINELKQVTFRSAYLESIWKKGLVGVSEANYLTMGYAARYTVKKAFGNSYPKEFGLPEEFTLMSRRPGIGASFLKEHSSDLDDFSLWHVHGKPIYWPSYILKKRHELHYPIHSLDLDGCISVTDFVFYDDKYQELKSAQSKVMLTNLENEFEFDERPYEQHVKALFDKKVSSIKKLDRGDVTLN